jgi:hypothetical protein
MPSPDSLRRDLPALARRKSSAISWTREHSSDPLSLTRLLKFYISSCGDVSRSGATKRPELAFRAVLADLAERAAAGRRAHGRGIGLRGLGIGSLGASYPAQRILEPKFAVYFAKGWALLMVASFLN